MLSAWFKAKIKNLNYRQRYAKYILLQLRYEGVSELEVIKNLLVHADRSEFYPIKLLNSLKGQYLDRVWPSHRDIQEFKQASTDEVDNLWNWYGRISADGQGLMDFQLDEYDSQVDKWIEAEEMVDKHVANFTQGEMFEYCSGTFKMFVENGHLENGKSANGHDSIVFKLGDVDLFRVYESDIRHKAKVLLIAYTIPGRTVLPYFSVGLTLSEIVQWTVALQYTASILWPDVDDIDDDPQVDVDNAQKDQRKAKSQQDSSTTTSSPKGNIRQRFGIGAAFIVLAVVLTYYLSLDKLGSQGRRSSRGGSKTLTKVAVFLSLLIMLGFYLTVG